MLNVLVVSDHPVVRAGLAAIVDAAAGCQVAGQCELAELGEQAGALRPDVVLLDAVEGDAEALAALARFTAAEPAIEVLAVSREAGGARARAVLAAGARGYLLWDAAGEEIAAALQAVAQGLTVLHPAAARQLLEGPLPQPASPALSPPTEPGEALTPRELEVLRLLAQGLPSKAISARLQLSEHTVKFHVGSIMGKLGAASRTEAVTTAIRRGLVVL
ncbi:MAG: LuxR C-terminal-related transcriptional regulator [Chloroflexota bacterium]